MHSHKFGDVYMLVQYIHLFRNPSIVFPLMLRNPHETVKFFAYVVINSLNLENNKYQLNEIGYMFAKYYEVT